MDAMKSIYQEIINDEENLLYTTKNIMPLYQASPKAKILIIGQAPGLKAEQKGKLFDDESGETLRTWLGVDEKIFYNNEIFAILPMDFYFPGSGKNGDLPPRKGFADKWHPKLLALMPNISLTIIIGNYALKKYLQEGYQVNLTTTVFNYKSFLPKVFPLIHPSKRNFRWHLKNKWFMEDVIPELQKIVKSII